MRKPLAIVVAVASLALAGWTFAEETAKKDAPSQTVTGEIVDLSCYLGHGAHGDKHKGCALGCIGKNGMPAGILTADSKVYLLLPDHGKEKAFEPIKEWAGTQVKVSGRVVNEGGMQAVMVHTAAKAS